MTQKSNSLLKAALIIFAVISLLYGLTYMFVPQIHVDLAGSEPVASAWLRWFGPILVALGIGSLMVLKNPANQSIFIKTLGIGTFLCGLTLVYSASCEHEEVGGMEFSLIPGIILIILSIMFWLSLKKSGDILN